MVVMVRLKTGRKHIFFKETIINIPLENLSKLSKERLQYLCNTVKLNLFGEKKELVGSEKSRHSASASNCSMKKSLKPKRIINFYSTQSSV